MNVLFSQLKKYLPALSKSPKEVSQAFTLTGQMIDKMVEVEYLGQSDTLLDLEVRQNRADLFSTIGLARELASYWNLELDLPHTYIVPTLDFAPSTLKLAVKDVPEVKRIRAVQINNIQVSESPDWLKQYLEIFGINSINNLVDLTNYVMLETGIPSHVFDSDLVGNYLCWELAGEKYKKMTTLAGEELSLTPDTLLISDGSRPLSLSFIGGKDDAVNSETKNIILELGIYNQGTVRKNSRGLKVITEASSRLEKFLDPRLIDQACSMLVDLILTICGGEVSEQFDFLNHPIEVPVITLRTELLRQIAGVEISNDFAVETLDSLGFAPTMQSENLISVSQALGRTDVIGEYDLIEEVVRFYGYDKIPTDKLGLTVVNDITPQRICTIDQVTDVLVGFGFDEVRSWVLVDEKKNRDVLFFPSFDHIVVTNSINEEVPILRSSIAVNLLENYRNLFMNGIFEASIFEIGKIFYKDLQSNLVERYVLGLAYKSLDGVQVDFDHTLGVLEKLLAGLGFSVSLEVNIDKDLVIPIAHSSSKFSLKLNQVVIGRIFITSKFAYEPGEIVVAELDLEALFDLLPAVSPTKALELASKVIVRDINIFAQSEVHIVQKVNEIKFQIVTLFDWKIIDRFPTDEGTKFTLRLSFVNEDEESVNRIIERL